MDLFEQKPCNLLPQLQKNTLNVSKVGYGKFKNGLMSQSHCILFMF